MLVAEFKRLVLVPRREPVPRRRGLRRRGEPPHVIDPRHIRAAKRALRIPDAAARGHAGGMRESRPVAAPA